MGSVIFGAAYIGPSSEWSWINTVAVIIVGIILFWILYKLVLSRLNWKTESDNKREKVKRVVITDEDRPNKNGIRSIRYKEEDREAEEVIVMPFKGELMEITKVPEPIFSEKMEGDGFAIRPCKGDIFSPINGIVKEIKSNKGFITFNTRAGREVILHIGLCITHLLSNGIAFTVKEGDKVYAGQEIGTIDLEKMIIGTSSIISPVVFTNLKENERIVVKQQGLVEAKMKGIVVIEIDE